MKVRDLIRQLQQHDGDHEVVPLLPDVSGDVIETDAGEQLVVVLFADPPEEDEDEDYEGDEEAANDNEN